MIGRGADKTSVNGTWEAQRNAINLSATFILGCVSNAGGANQDIKHKIELEIIGIKKWQLK